jgi:DNA (cytosine-5)-methyltransferase 1
MQQGMHWMTERPKLLDLFCCAGGAGMGYHRAGFDVVGVDINPQPRYPFQFVQGDALDYLAAHGHEFDAIHASPPCQKFTMAQNAAKNADAHPDLVTPIRELLQGLDVPWVIENVVGAPLRNPIMLCGLAFGLKVKRHRLFESNILLFGTTCPNHDVDYYEIFGHEVRNRCTGPAAGRKNKIAEGRKAMGIDWMTRGELSESIPPAYTEYIGRQLLAVIEQERAA